MDDIKQLKLAKSTIRQLLTLIHREQELLASANSTQLDDLVEQKHLVLQEAAQLEPLLKRVTDKTKKSRMEHSLINEIMLLLADCKEHNHENRQVTTHKAQMVSKSISFIESILNINTVKLYSPTGQTESRSEKRKLGVA